MTKEPDFIEGEYKAYDHNGKRSFSKNVREPAINWGAAVGMVITIGAIYVYVVGMKAVLVPIFSWLGL